MNTQQYTIFCILFFSIPTTLTSMQQPAAAAPTELTKKLDTLDLQELFTLCEGWYSCVKTHHQLPGFVFKEYKEQSLAKIKKLGDYAVVMQKIIADLQCDCIALPHYFLYTRDERSFIIAEQIQPTRTFKDLSVSEVRALLQFIQKAHYYDCTDSNILITDTKIYIIDFDFIGCFAVSTFDDLTEEQPLCVDLYHEIYSHILTQCSPAIQKQIGEEFVSQALACVNRNSRISIPECVQISHDIDALRTLFKKI